MQHFLDVSQRDWTDADTVQTQFYSLLANTAPVLSHI